MVTVALPERTTHLPGVSKSPEDCFRAGVGSDRERPRLKYQLNRNRIVIGEGMAVVAGEVMRDDGVFHF